MWPLIVGLILTIIVLSISRNPLSEHWQTYREKPFQYITTGEDPLYFYQLKQYRLPYEYPFTFYKSYPVPHESNYEPASGL